MNNSAKKRLGILVCGLTPDEMLEAHGQYGKMFQVFLGLDSFDYQDYVVVNGEFPNSVDDADAWLLTGSRHGVYEDHPWIPPLEQFVRDAYAADIPLVGICFGHQLLAQALGGKVEKFDGGWATGRMEYTMDEAVTGTTDAALLAWHQDQVVGLPPEAKVVGSNEFCQYAALAYGDGKALSMQPHPEFNDQWVSDMIGVRGDQLPDANREYAASSIGQPLDNDTIAATIRKFLSRQ